MYILSLGVLSIVTASSGESWTDMTWNRARAIQEYLNLDLVSLVKNFKVSSENFDRAVDNYERHLKVNNPVDANKIEEWKRCYSQSFETLAEITLAEVFSQIFRL